MRRSGPRPLSAALEAYSADSRPTTLLARVQQEWASVCGAVIAQESTPVSASGSRVVVACDSAVWANELELLEADLRVRLNRALGGGADAPVAGLRFRHARKP